MSDIIFLSKPMRKIFFAIGFGMVLPLISFSQHIYPIPQKLSSTSELTYTGVKSKNQDLQSFIQKKGISITEKREKNIVNEGYKLAISNKKITISYADERGKFYAYQSLKQILAESQKSGKLPVLTIDDAPDVAFRGTVEGFYGKPWSHEDRISQLRFYGDWKLNTYIYGPKDDPYHSSPKWREPYPADQAEKLKELVDIAKSNHVDFYWAIHPGQDIKWNKTDSTAVLNKFELMYGLGVRHFAVFFDDISGEGTKAEKQAGLLNYLQKEFVDKKSDVGELIMCPTEYNKGWSNHKEGTYLDILGDVLDKRIHIMWTGNTVIHDITLEGQKWVNKRIKRPSFVWWNFPVSDYVRNHLLLGESYGLDKDAKSEMSGFVTNPMDKPEASKVAIFSVANYSWNLKQYDPTQTWDDAISIIHPEIASSYKVFSSHNADPGPSYHQYRREESQKIGAILEKQTKSLIDNKFVSFSTSESAELAEVFKSFVTSSKDILANSKNPTLLEEIKPWLKYFEVEGKASQQLLAMNQANDLNSLYVNFQEFQKSRDEMIHIDQTENRNPYQPGIVAASRYVLPWIEQSYLFYHKKLKEAGFAVKDAVNQPSGKIYTNIEMLKALPIQNDVMNGNRPFQMLKLGRMLEYIPFKSNDYVGVEITTDSKIKEVKYRFDEKIDGINLQYSIDGINWSKDKNPKAKFIRLVNENKESKSGRLSSFEIIFE